MGKYFKTALNQARTKRTDAKFDEGIITNHMKEITVSVECDECGDFLTRHEDFKNINDMYKTLNCCLKEAIEEWNGYERLNDGE